MTELAAEKRNIILDAAIELFLEKGYKETTTREIAEASGMERGHLYYYYRKKEDILFDWYMRLLTRINCRVMEKYGRIDDPYLLVSIFDVVFYKYFFDDRRRLELFVSVLSNRHLCRMKADKTCEFYMRLFEGSSADISEEDIRQLLSVIIGAEGELIYDKENGAINLDYDQIIDKIIDIQLYLFGFERDEITEYKKKIFSLAD
jgi:AcrR family transcriptional regulator